MTARPRRRSTDGQRRTGDRGAPAVEPLHPRPVAILAGCSSDDSGKPELIWYINPDAGGQDAVAENCSTDDYTIAHPGPAAGRQTSSASSWPAGSRPRTRRST